MGGVWLGGAMKLEMAALNFTTLQSYSRSIDTERWRTKMSFENDNPQALQLPEKQSPIGGFATAAWYQTQGCLTPR
jgi:hypothetical protein